jgi:hypothetical protein
MHDIDVEHTAEQLERAAYGRFSHHVDWPHLWTQGDAVAILTSDKRRYTGQVLDVSRLTRVVLIELNPIG